MYTDEVSPRLNGSIHVLETTSLHHQLELYGWFSGAWHSVLAFLWLRFCCAVKGAFYKLTTSGSARVLERCSHRIFGREFWVSWSKKVKPKVESAKTEKNTFRMLKWWKERCKQHQATVTSLDRWMGEAINCQYLCLIWRTHTHTYIYLQWALLQSAQKYI